MSITDAGTSAPATSTADTRETEPEVIAGISSGNGSPDQQLSFRTGGASFSYTHLALLLGGGLALGYGISRWVRR